LPLSEHFDAARLPDLAATCRYQPDEEQEVVEPEQPPNIARAISREAPEDKRVAREPAEAAADLGTELVRQPNLQQSAFT
jgi:hypothetical protein